MLLLMVGSSFSVVIGDHEVFGVCGIAGVGASQRSDVVVVMSGCLAWVKLLALLRRPIRVLFEVDVVVVSV